MVIEVPSIPREDTGDGLAVVPRVLPVPTDDKVDGLGLKAADGLATAEVLFAPKVEDNESLGLTEDVSVLDRGLDAPVKDTLPLVGIVLLRVDDNEPAVVFEAVDKVELLKVLLPDAKVVLELNGVVVLREDAGFAVAAKLEDDAGFAKGRVDLEVSEEDGLAKEPEVLPEDPKVLLEELRTEGRAAVAAAVLLNTPLVPFDSVEEDPEDLDELPLNEELPVPVLDAVPVREGELNFLLLSLFEKVITAPRASTQV